MSYYDIHPEDRPRQCVFAGTSNSLDFLPLDRAGNRRFLPVMVAPDKAEVHILEDEAASRAYIDQIWAEAMTIYRSGEFRLSLPKALEEEARNRQKAFMPEDTTSGRIQFFLDSFGSDDICSRQIFELGLGRMGEPKQWEIREIKINRVRCEIQSHIIAAGYTQKEAVEACSAEYGWSDSDSNFSAKLSDQTLRYREALELADVLGYEIVWQKRRDD